VPAHGYAAVLGRLPIISLRLSRRSMLPISEQGIVCYATFEAANAAFSKGCGRGGMVVSLKLVSSSHKKEDPVTATIDRPFLVLRASVRRFNGTQRGQD